MSLLEFSREIKQNIPAAPEPIEQEVELPPDAPVVFLCYRRKDKDQVMSVQQALYQAGINTWRDEQSLRGGDDWDFEIKDVLKNQADYMLVLQTPNMLSQARSAIAVLYHQ